VAGWQAVFYTAADCPAGAIEVQGGATVKAGGWSITYDSLADVGAHNCFGPIWTRNGGGGSVFIAPSGTTSPGGWPTETEKPLPSGSRKPKEDQRRDGLWPDQLVLTMDLGLGRVIFWRVLERLRRYRAEILCRNVRGTGCGVGVFFKGFMPVASYQVGEQRMLLNPYLNAILYESSKLSSGMQCSTLSALRANFLEEV